MGPVMLSDSWLRKLISLAPLGISTRVGTGFKNNETELGAHSVPCKCPQSLTMPLCPEHFSDWRPWEVHRGLQTLVAALQELAA